MIRLFATHEVRPQIELEGLWDFTALDEPAGFPDSFTHTLPVPGCWEQHPDFLTYRGKGAYRKKLHIRHASKALRLEFKGVSHTAEAYFDGSLVGKHYNAYTPFSLIVPDVAAGEHELTVIVDNRFSEESALHITNDYYTYGGIIRPVSMERVGFVYIERMEFKPLRAKEKWQADIGMELRCLTEHEYKVSVKAKLGETDIDFGEVIVPSGKSIWISKRVVFPDVLPWSSENPRLYPLEARIFEPGNPVEPLDDLIERVGFREVKLVGRSLHINGEPAFLKGFNRHEDFGVVGSAIPFSLMVKDVELMIEMGANAVRTSHYPNDELFLDLCDEKVLYVLEENHARGLGLDRMLNPNFEKQCEDCNREMVNNHYNHPSIVMWGLLNECDSDVEEGREIYKKQYSQIRKLDESRPVTSATHKLYSDICLDLADIVSFNIYSGWYLDRDPEEHYLDVLRWAEQHGGKDKPVILSEFGAAALYGFREPTRVKWSEERQMDIIDRALEAYMKRPEVIGTFIWQFSDCRVSEGSDWLLSRARTRNNKGVVDDFRRPKLACEAVKKHYLNTRKTDSNE